MLIGEERDTDAKTVSFFSVDRSGTLWRGKSFGEQWWTGIEAVSRGVLFLHGFATPDLPGRKGITAVDCGTGDLLWKNMDLTFIAASGSSVYASQEAPVEPVVAEFNHRTGERVREIGRGGAAVRQVPRGDEIPENVEYPQVLLDDDASPVAAIVRKFSAPALPERSVEYGEHGSFLVIVHDRGDAPAPDGRTTYTRVLDVLERATGNQAMHVTLEQSVTSPAFGTFLVRGDMLYYVRQRKSLTAVELQQM
jgi:hypothetical protein